MPSRHNGPQQRIQRSTDSQTSQITNQEYNNFIQRQNNVNVQQSPQNIAQTLIEENQNQNQQLSITVSGSELQQNTQEVSETSTARSEQLLEEQEEVSEVDESLKKKNNLVYRLDAEVRHSDQLRARARQIDEKLSSAVKFDVSGGFQEFIAVFQKITDFRGLIVAAVPNALPAPLQLPVNGDFLSAKAVRLLRIGRPVGRRAGVQNVRDVSEAAPANTKDIRERERGAALRMQPGAWAEARRTALFTWAQQHCPAPLLWAACVPGNLTQTVRNTFDFAQLAATGHLTLTFWPHATNCLKRKKNKQEGVGTNTGVGVEREVDVKEVERDFEKMLDGVGGSSGAPWAAGLRAAYNKWAAACAAGSPPQLLRALLVGIQVPEEFQNQRSDASNSSKTFTITEASPDVPGSSPNADLAQKQSKNINLTQKPVRNTSDRQNVMHALHITEETLQAVTDIYKGTFATYNDENDEKLKEICQK